ncbi:acyltransferase [Streptomyces sp. WAC 06738]|uniref:PDZ domain-containing protein n=1 Tax=Streptomyces sp. WAC 06738 TaxID=2203210 RepID=UPI000F6D1254|nr:PDZ domain-containing protein [Streptomyces sp. WAC 06738]AZM48720.1 acyltransferase [Streptomyces sp. WAC 06738]
MALVRLRLWSTAALSALALVLTAVPLGIGPAVAAAGPKIVSVSPNGSGMACQPKKPCSLTSARAKVREVLAEGIDRDIVVQLGEGTYRVSEALSLDARDSGSAEHPVRWVGTGSGARIVGGRELSGSWQPTAEDKSVMVTDVPAGIDFDELFVNDERQVMARYPNYDESAPRLEGTTTLSDLNTRSAGWQDPTTGFVRAMHCHDWGSVSFTVTGRDSDQLGLNFVGDNNRPQDCGSGLPLKRDAVLVENIREELDVAGEWYLDRASNKLYLKPPAGVDLATAAIETGELDQLITLTGDSPGEPIHDIVLENLHFERTHRTLFNSTFEGLSRGDWSVVRKGAAYLKNARGITITKSSFTDLGGNAVFMDGYNERNQVTSSTFDSNGATDVHVVGSPAAVRNYAGNYFTTPRITDLKSGPRTEDYPRDILIKGNVMKNNGRYEKQTSSVNISMALDVTVRGNSLSDSPRACLNFSDNTWGGHLIQDNDIFDCVRETGDNGSINSWGRSRFWRTGASSDKFASLAEGVTFQGNTGGELTAEQARAMMHLDVIRPITIDHNRFWHDGDWAIDLDDGSSNFRMTNNVLLKGGVKLRDGFERTMHNNLILDGRTFEQVSYMPGGDVIERNVTLGRMPYDNVLNDPVRAKYTIGKNLFWNAGASISISPSGAGTEKLSADGKTINPETSWYRAGMDLDSSIGDPSFANPDPTGTYDFTLADNSPALALGFRNIPTTGFGAPGGALPPEAVLPTGSDDDDPIEVTRRKHVEKLMGADATNITTEAEQSSYAINDFKGLKLASVPSDSYAAEAGLLSGDLIRTINGKEVDEDRNSFWRAYNELPAGAPVSLGVRRASTDVKVNLTKITTPEQLNNTSGVVYTNSGTGTREHWLWRNASRGGAGAYLDDIDATQNIGDTWELDFNGTGLDIISQVNTDEGDVDITIDGKFYKTVSFHNPSRVHQKTVLSITDLAPGPHTITGTMKSGDYMIVDAFKTHPATAG